MAEPALLRESLRPGTPVVAGSLSVLPIERLLCRGACGAWGAWLHADKRAAALVVRHADQFSVIDLGAGVGTLDELLARTPGLDAALARTWAGS